MLVKIKMMDGSSVALEIEECQKILVLKQMLHSKCGIEVERQRLIHSGRVLADDNEIRSYSIADGDFIHLVARPVGAPVPAPSASQSPPNATRAFAPVPGVFTTVSEGVFAGTIPFNIPEGGNVDMNEIMSQVLASINDATLNPQNVQQIVNIPPQIREQQQMLEQHHQAIQQHFRQHNQYQEQNQQQYVPLQGQQINIPGSHSNIISDSSQHTRAVDASLPETIPLAVPSSTSHNINRFTQVIEPSVVALNLLLAHNYHGSYANINNENTIDLQSNQNNILSSTLYQYMLALHDLQIPVLHVSTALGRTSTLNTGRCPLSMSMMIMLFF